MRISKRKTVAIAIAIFLMFSMAASMVLVPTSNAHTPAWQIPTFAYIQVAPDPVGVGQTVHVFMWLNVPFSGAAATNDYRFHNYKLTITTPKDETSSQTFDYISDPTSSQVVILTPDEVGTYSFNFTFPGQDYDEYGHDPTSAFVNDTYLGSSASTTLTVQQEELPEPIASYPLPTEYWTRPIYGENNVWWTISSNWLGQGAPRYAGVDKPGARQQSYPGDAVGPQTAHIMWTKPLQSGGVVGGNNFVRQGNTYFEGSAYNQRFANPIVLNGKIYYTEPLSFSGAPNSGFGNAGPFGPTDCVDLRTGEVIWSRTDVPPLSFGYIYDVEDPNQHGVYPAILFTTDFARAFDADTGTPLFNVTRVPSGSAVLGPQGEHLRYVIANAGTAANPDWRLGEWNSSKLWGYVYPPNIAPTLTGMVPTSTGTAVDASISDQNDPNCRYDWNVSISFANGMPVPPPNPFNPNPTPFTVFGEYYNDKLLCYNGSLPNVFNAVTMNPYTYFAINLNASRGNIGDVLWWNTVNPPSGNVSINVGDSDPTVGVFVEGYRETMQWVGYSMTTGDKLWGPTPSQSPWDYYGNTGVSIAQGTAAYGNLYSSGFGGILYCYDLTDGSLLWTYGNGGKGNSTNSGFYTAYGDYPTFIAAIGDGIVYLITTEHTSTAPIYKGSLARAVNATDGTEIWTLSDYTSTLAGPFTSPPSYAIADGFATFFNGYDNQIYSVGRGPSATTVTASPKVSVEGDTVLVEGAVIDMAAGTMQNEQAARFPNGVPAVSDDNMTEWMGYVYQQKPRPTDVTGVEVVVSVLDPNTNCYEVGRATSDENGMFRVVFTPLVSGEYSVYASFEGSQGYWPSQAVTSINVEQAPAATAEPTPMPQAPVGTYFTISTVAIIVAIVIVGVLLLRKR